MSGIFHDLCIVFIIPNFLGSFRLKEDRAEIKRWLNFGISPSMVYKWRGLIMKIYRRLMASNFTFLVCTSDSNVFACSVAAECYGD